MPVCSGRTPGAPVLRQGGPAGAADPLPAPAPPQGCTCRLSGHEAVWTHQARRAEHTGRPPSRGQDASLSLHCGGEGSVSSQGTKIPCAPWHINKMKNMFKFDSCSYFYKGTRCRTHSRAQGLASPPVGEGRTLLGPRVLSASRRPSDPHQGTHAPSGLEPRAARALTSAGWAPSRTPGAHPARRGAHAVLTRNPPGSHTTPGTLPPATMKPSLSQAPGHRVSELGTVQGQRRGRGLWEPLISGGTCTAGLLTVPRAGHPQRQEPQGPGSGAGRSRR